MGTFSFKFFFFFNSGKNERKKNVQENNKKKKERQTKYHTTKLLVFDSSSLFDSSGEMGETYEKKKNKKIPCSRLKPARNQNSIV